MLFTAILRIYDSKVAKFKELLDHYIHWIYIIIYNEKVPTTYRGISRKAQSVCA